MLVIKALKVYGTNSRLRVRINVANGTQFFTLKLIVEGASVNKMLALCCHYIWQGDTWVLEISKTRWSF